MDIDEKIAEYKTDIEKCEHVCEMTAINSIRDAALRKAEDCKQMVEWLEDYKRLSSSEKPNKWIPLTRVPVAEERRKKYEKMTGIKEWTDVSNPMPEDGQEVIISCGDYVCTDTYHIANHIAGFWETRIEDVDAWMPLPEPYKADTESGGEE